MRPKNRRALATTSQKSATSRSSSGPSGTPWATARKCVSISGKPSTGSDSPAAQNGHRLGDLGHSLSRLLGRVAQGQGLAREAAPRRVRPRGQLGAHLGPVEKLEVAAFESGVFGRLHPPSSVPQGGRWIATPGQARLGSSPLACAAWPGRSRLATARGGNEAEAGIAQHHPPCPSPRVNRSRAFAAQARRRGH